LGFSPMAPTLSAPVRWMMSTFLSIYRSLALLWMRLRSSSTQLAGTPPEEAAAARRVVHGEAWNEFCDTLKAAGAALVAPGAPTDAFNQAEGYRYLARLTRAGLENFLECADVEAPALTSIANGMRPAPIKLGSDNPDNLYEHATIDGSLEYVVSGDRGRVPYLGFGTQSGSYGGKGGLATVDYVEADALVYDDAQRQHFTIVLSSERPPEAVNWLKLKPEPREAMFILRQTFGDRTKETPARVSISLRGGQGGPSPLTAVKLEQALQGAGVLVAGASMMFARWARGFQEHTNELPLFDVERSNEAGGDPNIRYYHSYWRIGPEEALRIKVRPPPCRCWNFQLNNHWMESLDYRYHSVHTNDTLARADEGDEEAYSIVVSHSNPNVEGKFRGNWISTVGHSCGTMCFRFIAPKVSDADLPHPTIAVVRVNDL